MELTSSKSTGGRGSGNTTTHRATVRVDLVGAVAAKYIEFGWIVIRPAEGVNDLITQKGKRMHFVRVVTDETTSTPAHSGINKNTFIQNAFSNAAAPIFATVTSHRLRSGDTQLNVTFENVNEAARVIIGGHSRSVADDVPPINN